MSEENNEITIKFSDQGTEVSFRFEEDTQGLWASVQNIADLYGIDRSVASKHIRNIFIDEELEESSVCAKFAHTANDGKIYTTNFYSLDMIISVGYRVNSKKATKFRKWSNNILRHYLEQGYVINEEALRQHPEKLNELAIKIRALRSEEKHIYARVRECFKLSSSDYDPKSKEVKSFYALLQDKFHHAVTGGLTASSPIFLAFAFCSKAFNFIIIFAHFLPLTRSSHFCIPD